MDCLNDLLNLTLEIPLAVVFLFFIVFCSSIGLLIKHWILGVIENKLRGTNGK